MGIELAILYLTGRGHVSVDHAFPVAAVAAARRRDTDNERAGDMEIYVGAVCGTAVRLASVTSKTFDIAQNGVCWLCSKKVAEATTGVWTE